MPEKKAAEVEEEGWRTEVDSKYRLVLLAAKRSKQLVQGARPRVHASSRKPTRVALEEVEQGLVLYEQVSREKAR